MFEVKIDKSYTKRHEFQLAVGKSIAVFLNY